MPSYFFRNQQNGFLVTDHKVTHNALLQYLVSPTLIWREKEVVLNGIKKNMKWKSEIKIGFVPVDKPEELGYQFGDEFPFNHHLMTVRKKNSNGTASVRGAYAQGSVRNRQ